MHKEYMLGVGIDDSIDFHAATRHTCASWLAILGYPPYTIMTILEHSTLSVTEHYLHLAPSMLNSNMKNRYKRFADATERLGFFPVMY